MEARAAAAATDFYEWQISVVNDPETSFRRNQAQLALVAGTEGIAAGQRPLAVAVPFATDWEQVTLAEARSIQADGHELASVMPWDQIAPEQRALGVEGRHPTDPAYPLQQPWSLLFAADYEEAARALAARLRGHNGPHDVTLAAVGDVMLDRVLGTAIGNGDLDFPFENVSAYLQNADVTVGNLESALGNLGEPAAKSYTFRAPPAAASTLARAGFDVVSLANNHAMDYGPQALLQAVELLQSEGVQPAGAGQNAAAARAPRIVQAKGVDIAFLAYVDVPVEGNPPHFDTASWTATEDAPGLAWAIPEEIWADVARATQQADHVVVILHSGYEYTRAPSPEQTAAARAAIDGGAALVIGHHAHVLQGVEFYGGGVIAYGLGNFAFTISGPPETAILQVWFDEEGVRQIAFVPAIVQPSGQPRAADESEAAAIRRQIYALTRQLN
jgi:poly-gamma-glutamate synthesis protein (capsule biosynthesis protein)